LANEQAGGYFVKGVRSSEACMMLNYIVAAKKQRASVKNVRKTEICESRKTQYGENSGDLSHVPTSSHSKDALLSSRDCEDVDGGAVAINRKTETIQRDFMSVGLCIGSP
jgi:hypothetical protein